MNVHLMQSWARVFAFACAWAGCCYASGLYGVMVARRKNHMHMTWTRA